MQSSPPPGNIFIISAASGTGKTTLVSRLLATNTRIRVCTSHTTRPPRTGEQHGQHYYFTDTTRFQQMIAENAFLEYAIVFGNYYGTSTAEINRLQNQGFDVILEIDVQGAAQIRRQLPQATSIFILPPDMETLAARLRGRATDSNEVIAQRLHQARNEIAQAHQFDYIVINDILENAQQDLNHIIRSRKLASPQQRHILKNFS